jgi:hypothetical protein
VRRLRGLGFDGPFSGTRHQFMVFGTHRLTIPSNAEYSVPHLRMLLPEAETIIGRVITAQEGNQL